MTARRIAVVGATGAVGREFLRLLQARSVPAEDLMLLASARSAGSTVEYGGRRAPVHALDDASFAGCALAFFSAGASVSRAHAPRAVAAGTLVVDNSSAFRLDPSVPLVVPEINPAALAGHRGLLAVANCTTILLAMAVHPIRRLSRVRRIVASTYQAVSGAGARAIDELRRQSEGWFRNEPPRPEVFPHPIGFNLIPQVDVFEDGGFTREEGKLLRETRKIFDDPELAVSATCVRVPVFRAHSVSAYVETAEPVPAASAREALAAAPGIVLRDRPERAEYPHPLDATGRMEVLVGRVRSDPFEPRGLHLFLSGDQLLKGAAGLALQLADRALGPVGRSDCNAGGP
jgi:aspartate-semialdehyde dehydrogenase